MTTYKTASGLSIEGMGLEDAIGQNFGRIAKHLQIGNAAGYRLTQVYAEYDRNIQAVVLHITACGSDCLVNYDPAEDMPKLYNLIINASEEDCPSRLDFELSNNETSFNPYDDACLKTPGDFYGTMLGIIDEIGLHHCTIPVADDITCLVSCQHPNTGIALPLLYGELCRARLMMHKPKNDKETLRMMARMFELAYKCMDYPKEKFDGSIFPQYNTYAYFKTAGKMTNLAAIRKAKGMTEEQLADAAQMSVRQLEDYEKYPGSTLWSSSKLVPERLADALGVKESEIVDQHGFPVLVDR